MHPDEFSAALAALGWSERGFAAYIRRSHTMIQRWASGDSEVPEDVRAWLAKVVEFHRANPPPAPPPPHPAGRPAKARLGVGQA